MLLCYFISWHLFMNRRRGKGAEGAGAKGEQREPRGRRHDAAGIRGMKNPAGCSIFQEYM